MVQINPLSYGGGPWFKHPAGIQPRFTRYWKNNTLAYVRNIRRKQSPRSAIDTQTIYTFSLRISSANRKKESIRRQMTPFLVFVFSDIFANFSFFKYLLYFLRNNKLDSFFIVCSPKTSTFRHASLSLPLCLSLFLSFVLTLSLSLSLFVLHLSSTFPVFTFQHFRTLFSIPFLDTIFYSRETNLGPRQFIVIIAKWP